MMQPVLVRALLENPPADICSPLDDDESFTANDCVIERHVIQIHP